MSPNFGTKLLRLEESPCFKGVHPDKNSILDTVSFCGCYCWTSSPKESRVNCWHSCLHAVKEHARPGNPYLWGAVGQSPAEKAQPQNPYLWGAAGQSPAEKAQPQNPYLWGVAGQFPAGN